MILTALPDLPPRPETAANAVLRERFYARWGRENALVCGAAAEAEYAEHPQTLSIKLALHGRERYFVGGAGARRRELAVDDDNYLVLNEGARYGSLLRGHGRAPAYSLAVFFRPGLAAEAASEHRRPLAAALDGPCGTARATGFAEHLRPHGDAPSRLLLAAARTLRDDACDGGHESSRDAERQPGECEPSECEPSQYDLGETWLDELCERLLAAMLDAEHGALEPAAPRAAQRQELRRRLLQARDLIESRHAEPLTLQAMADAACLSRHHFVREFGRAFGLTPHAWLTRKRARVAARRLAADASLDPDRLAAECGFGSRWSLRRGLARWAAIAPAATPGR